MENFQILIYLEEIERLKKENKQPKLQNMFQTQKKSDLMKELFVASKDDIADEEGQTDGENSSKGE